MAWRAIEMLKQNGKSFLYLSSFQLSSAGVGKPLVLRCKDWPHVSEILDLPAVGIGFSAAALIYGGLHILAWYAHFDSSTEQLLWRVSASVVMGGFPVGLFLLHFSALFLKDDHENRNAVLLVTMMMLFAFLVLAYVLARAYLVIECFINLSHLPAEVYDVPSWSTYFPHIS